MSWKDAKDWWKAPVLQGPENDYGDYDYLIEELPENSREWLFGEHRCESCGKTRHAIHRSTEYFRTMDGYDSLSYDECWICEIKSCFYHVFYKLKRRMKPLKYFFPTLIKEIKFNRRIVGYMKKATVDAEQVKTARENWRKNHQVVKDAWFFAKILSK